MRAFVRAAVAAALVLLSSVAAIAADKSFKRADLADAAIKLEAQIKAEAGEVTKPIAALRREVAPPSSAATTAVACRSSGRSSRSRPTVA